MSMLGHIQGLSVINGNRLCKLCLVSMGQFKSTVTESDLDSVGKFRSVVKETVLAYSLILQSYTFAFIVIF